LPASHNDWRTKLSADEIDNYVILFEALKEHLMDHSAISRQTTM
jgi:hypothetical protein